MTPKAAARLPAPADGQQVNCCKSPACENFGVAPNPHATAEPPPRQGFGPSVFYDGLYAIGALGIVRGGKAERQLECLGCGAALPLKSNAAIAAEVARQDGAPAPPEPEGCPNSDCPQHGRAPAESPDGYARHGRTAAGTPRLRCKACDRAFAAAPRPAGARREPWLHGEYEALRALTDHTPIRRNLARHELGAGRLYQLFARAHRAVRVFGRRADAAAGTAVGARTAPLRLAVDRQAFGVNWSDRSDRRKVMLHGVATADAASGYVFAMDVNYDPAVDPDALAEEAAANGDAALAPCYRSGDAARVWLPEERARRMEGGADVGATTGTPTERRYRRASARTDVETPEVSGRAPARGALVREDIALYAHFWRVRRLLGRPAAVRLYFEQESSMRAAAMTAWGDRIRAGRCEAFYVRIAKEQTAREKRAIGAASQARIEAVMAAAGCGALEARRRLVREALAHLERRGPWGDRWLRHPCPSAFEPNKEVCRLTRRSEDEDEAANPALADGYAFASLGAVDRFFMKVRYGLNPLDRARSTGQRHGRRGGPERLTDDKWDVYHPYNPEYVQALLDLLRFERNWCAPGEDGQTPAMRLGVAERPLELADALEAAGEDLEPVRKAQALLDAQRSDRRQARRRAVEAMASPPQGNSAAPGM